MAFARCLAPLAAVALLPACLGCNLASSTKLTAAETQNRILAEKSRAQLADLATVRERNRQLEEQLAAAEKELALIDGGQPSTRFAATAAGSLADGLGRAAATRPAVASRDADLRLAAIAQKHRALEFDPTIGGCRFRGEILFESGEVAISPKSEQALRDLATIIRDERAANLRAVVVGHTDSQQIRHSATRSRFLDNWHLSAARAIAVAEQLRYFGVAEDRLSVTGMGGNQPAAPNESSDERRLNRRVEIYLLPADTPSIGWRQGDGRAR